MYGEGAARGLLANVPVAEQELAAEIRLFDDIIVRDGEQAPRAGRDPHHGEVLQELAAQGSGAHKEYFEVLQLILQLLSKHSNLTIIPAALQTRGHSSGTATTVFLQAC